MYSRRRIAKDMQAVLWEWSGEVWGARRRVWMLFLWFSRLMVLMFGGNDSGGLFVVFGFIVLNCFSICGVLSLDSRSRKQ